MKLKSYMGEQQELINLMRKVKFKPSKFDQTSVMNNIFLKFDGEQKMRQDLEVIIGLFCICEMVFFFVFS